MKLYNTLTRSEEELHPLQPGRVTLYTCGLTVYSQPHIGNWVSYIYWDVLQRSLIREGLDVIRAQNITDVGHLTSDEDAGEDKMLASALKEGRSAWEVADAYIGIADTEAYERLGLLRPSHMPRATAFIEQQIAFVKELEAKGYTYTIADGVYFDTSKLQDYGKLARLDIEGLRFGARVETTGKKNPTDFALWKFSPKESKRDMEWESPWGTGFPGWHLECSAMARELLGDTIDIHTGGIDHIAVHHTNEIAQSEAVTGKPLAQIWLHANHIKVNGTKISKSLGNGYTLDDLEQHGFSLQAFKLMVLSKHYRTEGNFSWDILEAAQNRLQRWLKLADLRWQAIDQNGESVSLALAQASEELTTALSNDLDTPAALTAIESVFSSIEQQGLSTQNTEAFLKFLELIHSLLGLMLARDDVPEETKQLLQKRSAARTAQNWALADELRAALLAQNIEVKDTSAGQFWSWKA